MFDLGTDSTFKKKLSKCSDINSMCLQIKQKMDNTVNEQKKPVVLLSSWSLCHDLP